MKSTTHFFASNDNYSTCLSWGVLRTATNFCLGGELKNIIVRFEKLLSYTFSYSSKEAAKENLQRLLNELDEIFETNNKTIAELHRKVHMMWDAPGMPGYIEAENRFANASSNDAHTKLTSPPDDHV